MPSIAPTRVRRAALFVGFLAAAAGIVEARAATAPAARPVALAPLTRPAAAAPAGRGRPGRSATAAAQAAAARRSVLGAPIDIGYGIVQVRLLLQGSRISDVIAVQLPVEGRSADIAAFAVPLLRSEVLAQQSARIDTVSGASYTSDGYARSVQAALDGAAAAGGGSR